MQSLYTQSRKHARIFRFGQVDWSESKEINLKLTSTQCMCGIPDAYVRWSYVYVESWCVTSARIGCNAPLFLYIRCADFASGHILAFNLIHDFSQTLMRFIPKILRKQLLFTIGILIFDSTQDWKRISSKIDHFYKFNSKLEFLKQIDGIECLNIKKKPFTRETEQDFLLKIELISSFEV